MLENTSICFKHGITIDNLKEINNIIKFINKSDDINQIKDQMSKIQEIANDAIFEISLAKKDGMKMERRLKKYYRTMEYLGFERKRK